MDGGCVRPVGEVPLPLRISFSTCRMKFKAPPAGENMIVNRGQPNIPKQHVRSGFPADRGHNQKGVLGTVVTMHTPSEGADKNPLCGRHVTTEHGVLRATRLMLTILSNGTSISIFPIQKRRAPSVVMSTERTRLYQNQATNIKLTTLTATTVPWAPMGTAAIKRSTKMVSNRTNRALNASEYGADWKFMQTLPSSVTYVSVCAINNGSSSGSI
mmetsp:Transcript_18539/g.27495  ORF Transcript_18539/g.27495 Transcript_18539/m.27495 type:complete len:214 (+) Transcript_18539:344-985(+)